MMQVIDAAWMRSHLNVSDGPERLATFFGKIMEERDRAKAVAEAAGRGYTAALDAQRKAEIRVGELLSANSDLVEARRGLEPIPQWRCVNCKNVVTARTLEPEQCRECDCRTLVEITKRTLPGPPS